MPGTAEVNSGHRVILCERNSTIIFVFCERESYDESASGVWNSEIDGGFAVVSPSGVGVGLRFSLDLFVRNIRRNLHEI